MYAYIRGKEMIEYVVWCDLCGNNIDGSRISENHVRERAIDEGSMIRRNRKDICKSCVEEKKQTVVQDSAEEPNG